MSENRPLALVTGASSGIGADLARELAKAGHDLVLTARQVAPMEALAHEIGAGGEAAARAVVIPADLSQPGATAALLRDIESRGLILDAVVANAGLGANGPFEQADVTRLQEMLQVNVVALTELARAVLPGLVQRRRGRLMLVASTAGFQPGPQMAVYSATKAYVLSLGEAIAYELRGSGVTVTTLCPGATRTGFAQAAGAERAGLFQSGLVHVMTAADVARLAVRGMLAGRPVVITGFFNQLVALSGRFSPHAVSLPVASTLLSNH